MNTTLAYLTLSFVSFVVAALLFAALAEVRAKSVGLSFHSALSLFVVFGAAVVAALVLAGVFLFLPVS